MTPFSPKLLLEDDEAIAVSLELAGPGSRAYAFLIDWHLRVVVALLWITLALFVGAWLKDAEVGAIFEDPTSYEAFAVWIPAMAFYALYPFVFEIAWRGRTPGKRLAGIRVVDQGGRPASASQIIVRNLFRLLDSAPLLYGIGLLTMLLHPRHQRLGDLAAGAVLVHDPSASLKQLSGTWRESAEFLPPAESAFLHELLRRWAGLDPEMRRGLAASLGQRLGSAKLATGSDEERFLALQRLAGVVR